MALPNIHEFQAQEVVDYRQVNNNFSELNNNMLHYVTATVISYNSETYVTVVRINSNTTKSLINRTGNVLSVDDSVYVYYWTDIDTDGYVGIKLGIPVIEGGGESVGRYLNSSNNSVLVNDLNNTTRVEIEDNNQYNNIMVANSKIFYSKTLHGGSTYASAFSSSSIIGSGNNLYDVLMTNSTIIGNAITLNTYDSYDSSTDTYTFKALHKIQESLIAGYYNFITDNRTNYADTLTIYDDIYQIGSNNTFSIYDDAIVGLENQYAQDCIFLGNSNTIAKSRIQTTTLLGNSNTFSDTYIYDSCIVGKNNNIYRGAGTGSNIYTYVEYLSLIGYNNNIYNEKDAYIYDLGVFGRNNAIYHKIVNNNGTDNTNYIIGSDNVVGSNDTYITSNYGFIFGDSNQLLGANSSIDALLPSSYHSNKTTIIGSENKFKPLYSVSSLIAGYVNLINNSNDDTGKLNYSTIIGTNNVYHCRATSYAYDNRITYSTIIGNENIMGDTTYNTSIDLGYSIIVGSSNSYGGSSSQNSHYIANCLSIFGCNNGVSEATTSSSVFGYGNSVNFTYGATVCGYQNRVNEYRTTSVGSKLTDLNVFGNHNTVDPTTYDGIYVTDSTIIGSNNTLRTSLLNFTQCPAGNHFILGNHGAIDYNVNTDANKLKIVMAVETLYDSSVTNSNGNAVTIDYQGNMNVVGTITSAGSDFAEYWEWEDGNLANEDRRGLFVTLSNNGLIKIANSRDKILGVVSSKPTVAGGSDFWEWHGKYLKDVFGDYIYEDIEEPIYEEREEMTKAPYTDEQGNFREAEYETVQVQTGTKTVTRRKLNPDYDPEQVYTNRSERSEYVTIAHIGKVVMVDDGTANTGNYLTSTENGIATVSNSYTKFVCIKRLDETHIYVLIDNYQ